MSILMTRLCRSIASLRREKCRASDPSGRIEASRRQTRAFCLAVEPLENRTLLAVSFASAIESPAGFTPTFVATGDFNNDGKPDAVATNPGDFDFPDNTVSVLLGNGSGGFAAPARFATDYSPQSIAVGDLNGDGNQDLVTANSHNDVSVLLGNGNGGFAPAVQFAVGVGPTAPQSVAIGDFNSDGKKDLVTANFGTNNVGVLLGNGTGGFGPAVQFAVGVGGTAPQSVAIGDFNSDGKPDLVTANSGTNNVGVLLGNGAGSFAPGISIADVLDPRSMAVGDFNGDGKQDVITANSTLNGVNVLLGNGAGGFAAPRFFAVGGELPRSVAVADLNADGKLDAVVPINNFFGTGARISVLQGDGNGGFATPVFFAVGDGDTNPHSAAMGDFNGDGQPDVVTANTGTGRVGVLLNSSDAPLPPSFSISDGFATEGFTDFVVTYFVIVSRSGDISKASDVFWSTTDGTAVTPSDYVAVSPALLHFGPGEMQKTVGVTIHGDDVPEPDETFFVNLANATGATIADGQGIFTIHNDDGDPPPLPILSINDVSVTEGNSGTVNATFTVTRSGGTTGAVSVAWSTANGTAVAPGDYTAVASTQLQFNAGQTSKQVTVAVRGDTTTESNETFLVNLSNASGATIADGQGVGTILNDDGGSQAGTQVSLADSFNRIGIQNNGTTFTSGGLDGGGAALSGNLLGSSVTWNGNSFLIGSSGTNNVVRGGSGVTINLPAGQFQSLQLLATATNGNQASQTFTVRYTDGTTSTFTQGISDWYTPQGYSGESVALAMPYRNLSSGTADNRTFRVYGYSFALSSGKTVQSLTLPSNADVNVLAVNLGGAAAPG